MASYINKSDGALMLEFGHGDIAIAAANLAGLPPNELIFYPSTPQRLGDINHGDIGKSTAEVKALVRMVFNDPRSLDVLIHQAQELRSLMDAPRWIAEGHDGEQAQP